MTIDSTDSPAPMGGNVIPFGKHKGRLIEELILDDPAYLQWLSAQDWFRTKFTILHQTIINRGSEPEETPDHNAMQVRFLDNAFCLRFLRCLYSNLNDVARERVRMRTDAWQKSVELEYSLSERKQELKRKEDHLRELGRTSLPMEDLPKALSKARSRISELTATIRDLEEQIATLRDIEVKDWEFYFEREFEDGGVDVTLRVRVGSKSCGVEPNYLSELHLTETKYLGGRPIWGLLIELKPTIGDDYPAVLRQMKRNLSDVLFVGEYTGKGATEEQFVKTFATASKRVVFARELEG